MGTTSVNLPSKTKTGPGNNADLIIYSPTALPTISLKPEFIVSLPYSFTVFLHCTFLNKKLELPSTI